MLSDELLPPVPDLDGDGPLWQQIRRAIERPILTGDWPPGSPVPSELQLMTRYGTARMTVNRALRSLADQGLVERRRKRGTVVGSLAPERPVFEIWDIAAEIERAGATYRLDLLERAVLDAGDSRGAALGEGAGQLLWLVCRHSADGEPMQVEERLISLATAPQAIDADFAVESPGRWLLQYVAWTEAEHVIAAEPAPRAVADRLGIRRGGACLVVERRTWNRTAPVTFVRLWHPGDRRRLVGRFQRAMG